MDNKELIREFRVNPLLFIEKIWGLVPQKDKDAPFVDGKNITWQQAKFFEAVSRAMKGLAPRKISVRSGHGVGKSSGLAMLILWFLFCFKNSIVPCTAPTSDQLHDILWKELGLRKNKMPPAIAAKFEITSGYIRCVEDPDARYGRARTANKEKPEALAGIHAKDVLLVGDECSGIDDAIFNASKGALTNPNSLFVMISNPTRLIGYFHRSHTSLKDEFQCLHFNSEESPIVNQKFVEDIIKEHGKDSDEYRIRVQGEFPKADAVDQKGYLPLIQMDRIIYGEGSLSFSKSRLGIDIGGMGRDETIRCLRDEFKAKVVMREKISSTKGIAAKTIDLINQYNIDPTNVTIDNFGVGANISKEILLTSGMNVYGVNVGEPAIDREKFINMRAEAFWMIRQRILAGGELIDKSLRGDLAMIRYRSELNGKIKIMSKEDMRKMFGRSPDIADALMLTFISGIRIDDYQGEDLEMPRIDDGLL